MTSKAHGEGVEESEHFSPYRADGKLVSCGSVHLKKRLNGVRNWHEELTLTAFYSMASCAS
jgi:hypothetical protein